MSITEIAPDVFRLSLFVPEFNLQFNQFVVRDEEPLLFHTGMRAIFPQVREAVAQVIDPSTLRHVSFSHFELTNAAHSTSGSRSHRTPRRSAVLSAPR
jgi:flavorubredoxin